MNESRNSDPRSVSSKWPWSKVFFWTVIVATLFVGYHINGIMETYRLVGGPEALGKLLAHSTVGGLIGAVTSSVVIWLGSSGQSKKHENA